MTENRNDSMENWEIDMFCPKDAPGLVELYRAVYGDDYPVETVYEPEKIIRESQNGDSYRVIARTGQTASALELKKFCRANIALYKAWICADIKHLKTLRTAVAYVEKRIS